MNQVAVKSVEQSLAEVIAGYVLQCARLAVENEQLKVEVVRLRNLIPKDVEVKSQGF